MELPTYNQLLYDFKLHLLDGWSPPLFEGKMAQKGISRVYVRDFLRTKDARRMKWEYHYRKKSLTTYHGVGNLKR